MLKDFIEQVSSGVDLSEAQAQLALGALLEASSTDDDRAKFLESLVDKGESVGEICGFVRGMLERCEKVELGEGGLDLCGTGGSGLERFNVSTTVAFVLGSLGVKVVKHGNRGSHKQNGSFDLLEALGVPFDLSEERLAEQLKAQNLCFLFARAHHPAVKAVGPARARLGRRTIFNLVGPLCNPAGVQSQVLGVSDPALGPKMAEVLKSLGRGPSVVVWGEPGIDEFSAVGKSLAWWVGDGKIREESVDPAELGVESHLWEALPKGDCQKNAEIFRELLSGQGDVGLMDMVSLNAGAGLVLAGKATDLKAGYVAALEQMKSGRVASYFKGFVG